MKETNQPFSSCSHHIIELCKIKINQNPIISTVWKSIYLPSGLLGWGLTVLWFGF